MAPICASHTWHNHIRGNIHLSHRENDSQHPIRVEIFEKNKGKPKGANLYVLFEAKHDKTAHCHQIHPRDEFDDYGAHRMVKNKIRNILRLIPEKCFVVVWEHDGGRVLSHVRTSLPQLDKNI